MLSTQQDQQCTVSIVDLLTGTSLADFKQGGVAGERSVCLIGQDYLVAAEKDRPKLNIWHLNRRNAFHKKMIVPGVVNAMLVSPCSTFLLAAIATKLYVWQVRDPAERRPPLMGNLVVEVSCHRTNRVSTILRGLRSWPAAT